MQSLSVQPVDEVGFTLYFYAFTDEQSPAADLQAVENRSWPYQRPFNIMKVQHLHGDVTVDRVPVGGAGYGCFMVSAVDVLSDNLLGLVTSNTI